MATKRTQYLGVQNNSLADMVRLFWENLENALREYWGMNLHSFRHETEGKGFRLHVTGYNMGMRKDVTYYVSVLYKGNGIRIVVSYHQAGEHLTWEVDTFGLGTDIGTLVEATDLLGIEAYRKAPANGRNETASTTYSWNEEAWRQKCLAEQAA